MPQLPTLYLIDGSSYIFRAFYAVRPLSTSRGLPTNALYGFTQMIMRLLKEERPTHLAMVFDSREPTEREVIFPEYKANRKEPPDDLIPQFPYFRQITEALDVHTILQPGVEADDIIGTMAYAHAAAGGSVVIVTGDKDFMQLVSPRITLLDTMKEKRSSFNEVKEKFGVIPEEVVEVMGLMGDAVDNIPGVRGVGPKTAIKLIQKFHTVANLYNHLDDVEPGSLREKLKEQKNSALLSRNLVEIRKNIPLEFTLNDLTYAMPSPNKFTPLFKELEFTRLLREMLFPVSEVGVTGTSGQSETVAGRASPVAGNFGTSSSTFTSNRQPATSGVFPNMQRPTAIQNQVPTGPVASVVDDVSKFQSWIAKLGENDPITFVVVTDDGHPLQEPLVGIALSAPSAGAIYCPVGHCVLEPQLRIEELQSATALWTSPRTWWGFDVKPRLEVLDAHKIHITGYVEDGMLMQYLLGGATAKNGETFLERAGYPILKLGELLGKGAKKRAIGEMGVASVALWAGGIAHGLAAQLQALKESLGPLLPLYHELELPLLRVLKDMEETGVLVDPKVLEGLHGEFSERLSALEKDIYALAGMAFNIQSPKQLGDVLFNKLQIAVVKKTKTGVSTDSEVLEELVLQYPIAQRILDYRQLSKLQSTYVEALPRLADSATGRIHTSYNQAVAATGRLSSSDPNLQNIPIRSDDGRKIRAAFVAPKNAVLVSADYSQIELRILAHVTEEPKLIEAFQKNEDIHSLAASQIFNVPLGKVAKAQRAAGKTVNFAVLYGQSSFGLSKQLGIPPSEAKTYIDNYFARYARVAQYREQVLETARQTGYVETLFGRRRQFPDLKHANKGLRSAAERMAFNTIFQGTAADIIKRAMIRVHARLQTECPTTRLILQVHDELVVETPDGRIATAEEILRTEMEGAASLKVPLTVDISHGRNWSEC